MDATSSNSTRRPPSLVEQMEDEITVVIASTVSLHFGVTAEQALQLRAPWLLPRRCSQVFQCFVNGAERPFMSCQFGTIFTEPVVPHSVQARRRAIVGQGRSGGRLSSRTSTMRWRHLPLEHFAQTM